MQASPTSCSRLPEVSTSCAVSRARSCPPLRTSPSRGRRNELLRDGRHAQTPRRQRGRRGRALGARQRKADRNYRAGNEASDQPAELVLSARAGTPLAEIETLLEKNNQELAFEPMDYGPLLGGEANGGTLGGVIAANLSGPRRIKAGAARDHFLGVTAVTGRGETIKSGGRVVKNVTGYDLCKLLAGSWGTLAAMTDITVKVLPKAETEATVLLTGLDDVRACVAMAAAMASSCDVSGAAHLPDHVASWFDGLPGP